jgi:hypothetical protein
MDDTLRSDALLNSRTLEYRFANLGWNPDDGYLIWDDASDEVKLTNEKKTETTEESKMLLDEIKDS